MKKKIIGIILVLTLLGNSVLMAGEKLSLMLDWFPNVDHLPIYVAKEKGYFSDQGIEVTIISPSETSDALKLAASGNMDLAVSYQPQTIIAADNGLPIKVVAPLVVHPLTTLLFLEGKGIKNPSDLSHKKIGYTVPGLMDVLLEAFAVINKIQDYTPVNVGFTILPALVSNKVDAVMGPFKTYETVGMAQHGYKAQFFELEKWGIPDYEELIFVCGEKILEEKPAAVKGFVKAIEKAFAYTKSHPEDALATYLSAVPQADKKIETQAFELTRPYFAVKTGHNLDKWQAFADFALEYGLIKNKVDAASLIHTWK
ncbi:MAG: ABC transporter substrate-binding protein [Deltaproteobacteria bacterium]|uniref:ABC transporter substrate-binding protein n=1 Tax=Desulfobacula sp. TaxID=2593537 RepID=UPI0019A34D21|nr:ABC transporter substrate-binding protein [Candidatus Desulfobacula maris]MBL6996086.1 ABC transporter substrate-binding protein [Desulfobacula sp.]